MKHISLMTLVFAAGCGPGLSVDEDSGAGPGGAESSSGVAPTSSTVSPTTTTAESSTGGDADTSGSTGTISGAESSGDSTTTADGQTFIMPPGDVPTPECDMFAQECPEGMKCMPYADDGGSSWNNTKCVPVMEDPAQPGEPCFVEGNGVSGIDNCDFGAMCWDTDAENQGTCVALCTGTVENPMCPPGSSCAITSSGILNLCLVDCDPLAEEPCPSADDVCIPHNDHFQCVLDASGEEGQVNDPCMFANTCDPGLYCIESASAVECDEAFVWCCQPFCDTTGQNMCAGAGQACVPWYEEGNAPPGYEEVGICTLPG